MKMKICNFLFKIFTTSKIDHKNFNHFWSREYIFFFDFFNLFLKKFDSKGYFHQPPNFLKMNSRRNSEGKYIFLCKLTREWWYWGNKESAVYC